jgi:hypothetical protein
VRSVDQFRSVIVVCHFHIGRVFLFPIPVPDLCC